jgi:LysM repeat protein
MDINDSNNKSQQTGGLKLMTVFIAVLALHVVVIGGFTVYHLMSGGGSDVDITSIDKNHKSMDAPMPDASTADKSTATPPTEVATIPSTTVTPTITPAPAADTTAPSIASAPSPTLEPTPTVTSTATAATTPTSAPTSEPASAPAPTASPTVAQPTPASTAPEVVSTIANPGAQTPTGPIPPDLAPPPDAVPGAPVAASSASLATGPVHMPPPDSDASRVHHAHEQIYVVKITDSYKKIAHAHHCTVAQLKEANHIKGDILHTGQKLFIPSAKTEVAESASPSTLSSAPAAPIANESTTAMTTGLMSTSTTVATTGGLHHHMYTVVKGDTLRKIAHRFKTTASAIMAENGITDPTKLSIGRKLRIPSRESRSASNNVPAVKPPAEVQTAQLATFAQ